jgi:hypothetical protein
MFMDAHDASGEIMDAKTCG